ncbi:MAG: hypothetical protein KF721_09775 [Ignavibacteriaceae bacterium]|nr:hypothetical protein [Ignavibacteriaceae bacterium]
MDYSLYQTISAIIILVGIFLTGLGGFGQYYFSHKLESQKDSLVVKKESELNLKIDELLKGNELLRENIKPFEALAKSKYPNDDINTALDKLSEEIKNIEAKQNKTAEEVTKISAETQKTVFEVKNSKQETLPDGKIKYSYELHPIGKNIIPILSITCSTENGAVISTFEVKGQTVPIMSSDSYNENKSVFRKEYRQMYPGKVNVVIIVESPPGKLNVGIDPIKL